MGKVTGKPNGRPPIVWTEAQYEDFKRLCGMHCTLMEILGWFDISERTLRKLLKKKWPRQSFSELFQQYSAKGKVSLRQNLFRLAQDPKNPDFRALKWLSTNHLGMSERIAQKIEVEERRVVNIDLSWADEDPGIGSPDKDAKEDATPKKIR